MIEPTHSDQPKMILLEIRSSSQALSNLDEDHNFLTQQYAHNFIVVA